MAVSGISLKDIVALTLRRGTPILDGQNPSNQQLAILNFSNTGPYALDGVLPVFTAPLLIADQEKLASRFTFDLDADLGVGEDGITDGAVQNGVTWSRFFSINPEVPEDYSDIGSYDATLETGLPLNLYVNESLKIYKALLGFEFDLNNSANLDTQKSIVAFGTVENGYDTETREDAVKAWRGYDVAGFSTVAMAHYPGDEWSNNYSVKDNKYLNDNAKEIAFDGSLPIWRRLITTPFKSTVHEQGHTLGLTHPGFYNGNITGIDEFIWTGDSWDESTMSYAQQPISYEYFGNSEGFALLNLTPRTLDLLALDQIYSSQEDSSGDRFGTHRAFQGDTIYGFNTNITDDQSSVYANLDKLYNYRIATTIADGSGQDTIDASGFEYGNTIDLHVMTGNETSSRLSKINGNIGNLSLAVGTVIENAIGGNSDDKFFDNEYNNRLVGNGGNDWFTVSGGRDRVIGGGGKDRALIQGNEDDFIINAKTSSKTVIRHRNDRDYRVVLKGVEHYAFGELKDLGLYSVGDSRHSRGRSSLADMSLTSSNELLTPGTGSLVEPFMSQNVGI